MASVKKAADAAGRKLAFVGMSLNTYLEAAHRWVAAVGMRNLQMRPNVGAAAGGAGRVPAFVGLPLQTYAEAARMCVVMPPVSLHNTPHCTTRHTFSKLMFVTGRGARPSTPPPRRRCPFSLPFPIANCPYSHLHSKHTLVIQGGPLAHRPQGPGAPGGAARRRPQQRADHHNWLPGGLP